MPQPYLPTFQGKDYSVGFNALDSRPKFEAALGRCIALWSYVDEELGNLFGIMLGTRSAAAHRVFLILRRWSNQRQALDGAAEEILSGDGLAVYRALIVEYGSLESQRNDLGHGCFGICPDDEDLLFMIKVDHHVIWRTDILPKLDAGTHRLDPHIGLKEKMWVYRLADFERLHSQMTQLRWDIAHFNSYLRRSTDPGRDAEFQTLFSSTRIQQRIAALK